MACPRSTRIFRSAPYTVWIYRSNAAAIQCKERHFLPGLKTRVSMVNI